MTNQIKAKPKFKTAEKLDIINIEKQKLSNGIPYYLINGGEQDVVKIDFIIKAGKVYNKNPLIADAAIVLADVGTKNKTAEQIAEKLDFYGAFLELNAGMHFSKITLYTLNKYLKETIAIVADVFYNATFPESEIELYVQNKYQTYLIERQKTNAVSHEVFYETIFGENHPYGINITEKEFKDINSEKVKKFYNKKFKSENLTIILAGKINEDHISLLNDFFGKTKVKKLKNKEIIFPKIPIKKTRKFISIENTVQSSIRIGKKTINRTHQDYFNLNITSIILGGYFGSRLMTNIREDKGYTYGIYASTTSMIEAGVFQISAESGKDVYKKAIVEIYKELKILRTTLISSEELNRVKNYLIGNFSRMFDGAFAVSETLRTVILYDMNLNYYKRFFETVKEITPEIIMNTAKKYLNENTMIEIVVGAK